MTELNKEKPQPFFVREKTMFEKYGIIVPNDLKIYWIPSPDRGESTNKEDYPETDYVIKDININKTDEK